MVQSVVRRSLVACMALAMANVSLACMLLPKHVYLPVDELVASAELIVIAEAVEREAGVTCCDAASLLDADKPEFTFAVREVLKGRLDDEPIKIRGIDAAEHEDYGGDFEGHRALSFWDSHYGNATSTSYCAILGFFEVGETYLLILMPHYHLKSFEIVRSEEDRWLQVVRESLAGYSH